MNRLFNWMTTYQRIYAANYVGQYLSVRGAQTTLAADLNAREEARRVLFERELKEINTADPLDRALLKAHHSKLSGAISAVAYHRIADKVGALKKLRFTEEYERLQDPATVEYMKHKVAAEVGGPEEREAFLLYSKAKIEEIGEDQFRLFSTRQNDSHLLKVLK